MVLDTRRLTPAKETINFYVSLQREINRLITWIARVKRETEI